MFLSSFVTAPEGHAPALKDVSVHAMQAHTVRHTQNVVKRTLLLTKLHEEWRAYARYICGCKSVLCIHSEGELARSFE